MWKYLRTMIWFQKNYSHTRKTLPGNYNRSHKTLVDCTLRFLCITRTSCFLQYNIYGRKCGSEFIFAEIYTIRYHLYFAENCLITWKFHQPHENRHFIINMTSHLGISSYAVVVFKVWSWRQARLSRATNRSQCHPGVIQALKVIASHSHFLFRRDL